MAEAIQQHMSYVVGCFFMATQVSCTSGMILIILQVGDSIASCVTTVQIDQEQSLGAIVIFTLTTDFLSTFLVVFPPDFSS